MIVQKWSNALMAASVQVFVTLVVPKMAKSSIVQRVISAREHELLSSVRQEHTKTSQGSRVARNVVRMTPRGATFAIIRIPSLLERSVMQDATVQKARSIPTNIHVLLALLTQILRQEILKTANLAFPDFTVNSKARKFLRRN